MLLIKAIAIAGLISVLGAIGPILGAVDQRTDILNTMLNLLSLVVLVGGILAAPRYLRSRKVESELASKDSTIHTYEQSIAAMKERLSAYEIQLVSLKERAEKLEDRSRKYQEIAERFQGRYEEQSKYTAKEALRTIENLISAADAEAGRRHTELMEMLSKVALPPNGGAA